MPSLTQLREQRRLLEEKYGDLAVAHIEPPPPREPARMTGDDLLTGNRPASPRGRTRAMEDVYATLAATLGEAGPPHADGEG